MAAGRSGMFTIAEKEFFDHIRSRKFLLIFSIFLVIAIIGMIGGISEYNQNIKSYNERVSVISSSVIPDYIGEKPSVMTVFLTVSTYLVFLGAILGIAMGFDLITKEKESKSLKILLSHPIYRDEVINGKALGGIAALCIALAIVLLISFATLLIYGIVPEANELVLIAVFGVVSFLLIFTYFAISLFMSTACNDSGSALIFTMILFIVLSSLFPMVANNTVMESVIGSPPQMPQELIDQMRSSIKSENETQNSVISVAAYGADSPAWDDYNKKMTAYWEHRAAVQDALALFSPTMNYERIMNAITISPGQIMYLSSSSAYSSTVTSFDKSEHGSVDISGILAGILGNLVALLVFPACFFCLAYIRFMRMDVR